MGERNVSFAELAMLAICAASALPQPAMAQSAVIRPLAFSASSFNATFGPDLGQGVTFANFFAPVINNAGQVLFRANVDGNGVIPPFNDRGWWIVRTSEAGAPGSIHLVERRGEPAPGIPGYTYDQAGAQLGHGDTVLLQGTVLSASGSALTAIWYGPASGPSLVLRNDDPRLPFGPGLGISVEMTPSNYLSGTSSVASSTIAARALWALQPATNDLRTIAVVGDQPQGVVNPGETIAPWTASFDRFGNAMIWSGVYASGVLSRVAILNQPIAGQVNQIISIPAPSCTTVPIGFAVLDPTGGLLVERHMYSSFCSESTDDVLTGQMGNPGALQPVLRTGDAAPGLPPGFVVSSVTVAPRGAGSIVIRGTVSGPGIVRNANDACAWYGEPGALQLLWKAGDPVPGVAGATLDSIGAVAQNSRDQFVVWFGVSGPGITASNNRVLVAFDPVQSPTKLLQKGDVLPGPGGVLGTVSGFTLQGGSDESRGFASALNDRGECVFAVQLSDGNEGIYLAASPSMGACCRGTTCTIESSLTCLGAFEGAATACGMSDNPTTCCRANFNGVNGLNVQDIFDFLNAWFAGDPRADFNGLDDLSVQDIFDHLNAWFSGC